MKLALFNLREDERPFVDAWLKEHPDVEVDLHEGELQLETKHLIDGKQGIVMFQNRPFAKEVYDYAKEQGVKVIANRMAGFDIHDIKYMRELGISMTNVPRYSPNAIAELSLTLAMSLLRHVSHTVNKTSKYDFRVDGTMFSKEIRNCKVGIIGTGKIGLTEAKLFRGLGGDVYGYDVFQSEEAKHVVKFVEMDDLLERCDIVSLHVPYFPGKNDKMVNAEFISKMKDGAILINTARGELQDNEAILEAIKSGKLDGFGTDVFANEAAFFFKKFENGDEISDQTVRELVDLYPKVLVTPHIGSNTDEALSNMIEISYDNLNDVITTGSTANAIELPTAK